MGHNRPHNLVRSKEVLSVAVKNMEDEDLGIIEEIMLDKINGNVVYLVLNSGSFLGMGGRLFAIPWNAIHYDTNEECFILDIEKETLKEAPSFDKDNWPDMANSTWADTVVDYFNPERQNWE